MVITRLKLGQYEGWVIIEGQEIEHYAIEVNEETMVASCWIASTAGKVNVCFISKRRGIHQIIWCLCSTLV
jgi:hypothetical protein